ncbi:DUF5931 domain-containing protein, partial [Streptomyces sp. NPDC059881]|uniref:DUF5931 domain-containing protein n=1 Tax=Streptomyces sp. NPDC059881 TaxID=3346986 RepID=UPI00365E1C68
MAKRERVVRMSVELPLWRALTAYRVLTMGYAVALFLFARDKYERPWVAVGFLAVMVLWTLATHPRVANPTPGTPRLHRAHHTNPHTRIKHNPPPHEQ